MKVITEHIVRYYVMDGDCIYGGPFETKIEAQQCLRSWKLRLKQEEQMRRAGIPVVEPEQ